MITAKSYSLTVSLHIRYTVSKYGRQLKILDKLVFTKGIKMIIRRFRNEDSIELADVIAKTLRTTNIKDYSPEYIENDISFLTAEKLIERSEWTNLYVVCEDTKIIGCGAIGAYWGKEDESSLYTIFVLPEYQGKGVGRKIVETLEQDEYFIRAKRIEIPSSITAVEFYRKMGYDYKNGIAEIDEEQLYRLEKFR